jgi:hypothetical protein
MKKELTVSLDTLHRAMGLPQPPPAPFTDRNPTAKAKRAAQIPMKPTAQKAVMQHYGIRSDAFATYELMALALARKVSSPALRRFVNVHAATIRFCDLCCVARRVENGMGLTRAVRQTAVDGLLGAYLQTDETWFYASETAQFCNRALGLRLLEWDAPSEVQRLIEASDVQF